ncbi:hypothetical protein MAGR_72460 [Mycolicibacterium agri]|uniref:Uncharacterized protein n=1 Tax=Mycolicibacterium agri TaxID=36811 RepID=A0A7I9WDK1_MYCAG|nr:hypothetical protein MAGR_72460 [Mycolicibacterium agri]
MPHPAATDGPSDGRRDALHRADDEQLHTEVGQDRQVDQQTINKRDRSRDNRGHPNHQLPVNYWLGSGSWQSVASALTPL